MRTIVLRLLVLAGALFTTGACTESPTAAVPDASTIAVDHDEIQGCVTGGVCVLDPIGSDPGTPCDPTISECDDGGWDSCISSLPGTGDPGSSTISCAGGGGSGAGGDGGTGDGGGDGDGDERVCPDYGCDLTPYEEGPFLWAACVLAVVGGTFSVEVVGDKFVAWYGAHGELVSARRSLDATLGMQRAGYVFDPASIELLYYKVEVATKVRDDAVVAVKEATGVSILTLIGAGLACGAAAAAPTP